MSRVALFLCDVYHRDDNTTGCKCFSLDLFLMWCHFCAPFFGRGTVFPSLRAVQPAVCRQNIFICLRNVGRLRPCRRLLSDEAFSCHQPFRSFVVWRYLPPSGLRIAGMNNSEQGGNSWTAAFFSVVRDAKIDGCWVADQRPSWFKDFLWWNLSCRNSLINPFAPEQFGFASDILPKLIARDLYPLIAKPLKGEGGLCRNRVCCGDVATIAKEAKVVFVELTFRDQL